MSEPELAELAQQWQAIPNEEERNQFYDAHVFPAVQQVVIPREIAKYPEPFSHLILPVGLYPEPLILSIRILRPERVYLLYTHDSEKYLNRIFQESGLALSQIKHDRIDETNVPEIYQRIRQIYIEWKMPQRMAMDISGGKKSMTGGCALAGALLGAQIFYMDSKFNQKLRKPEPGSEHLVVLENPYRVFGDLEFERAQSLFNKHDYVSAKNLLDELWRKTAAPELYEARTHLCAAYAAWDDWRIKEAKSALQQAVQTIERYGRLNPNTPLYGQLPRLQEQMKTLLALEQALAVAEDALLSEPRSYRALLGTLRAGALRQEARGKFDVAALMWYRIIEFLSQRRLNRHGISTANPNYSNVAISTQQLVQQYQRAVKESSNKKNNLPQELPDPIGLLDGYFLLKALGDPFVQDLHVGRIRSKINARNSGIFAHGFKPLSADDYKDFKELAEGLLYSFVRVEDLMSEDWASCEFVAAL